MHFRERLKRRELQKQLQAIPEEGTEAFQLWRHNQLSSPLLRLPAELRIRIYEYVLYAGIIIVNHHQSAREKLALPASPRFNFWCQRVEDTRLNPHGELFKRRGRRRSCATGVTLLSSLCRQLYQETVLLPYRLNGWAFQSSAVMERFLVTERRLNRQQRRAIGRLYVKERLSKKMEKFFGGLEVIVWCGGPGKEMQEEVLGEIARSTWHELPAGGRMLPRPGTFPPPWEEH